MEVNGIGMISERYSAKDYIDLNLSINSDYFTWDKAIEIVKERFDERFFSTIHYLSMKYSKNIRSYYDSEKIKRNGFAIMAINCLLIDTFFQFKYGLNSSQVLNEHTNSRYNSDNYVYFLETEFPDLFPHTEIREENLARLFYNDIRCGILHSAQTYRCSVLAPEGDATISYTFDDIGNPGIRVNVGELSKRLEYYFDSYIRQLRDEKNTELRENFIKKMRFVCNIQ